MEQSRMHSGMKAEVDTANKNECYTTEIQYQLTESVKTEPYPAEGNSEFMSNEYRYGLSSDSPYPLTEVTQNRRDTQEILHDEIKIETDEMIVQDYTAVNNISLNPDLEEDSSYIYPQMYNECRRTSLQEEEEGSEQSNLLRKLLDKSKISDSNIARSLNVTGGSLGPSYETSLPGRSNNDYEDVASGSSSISNFSATPLNKIDANSESAISDEDPEFADYSEDLHLRKRSKTSNLKEPELKYTCELCTHTTHWKGNLKRHILTTHSDYKPYQCPHCSYNTGTKALYKAHLHTHTGNKPFQCELCSYGATQKRSLLVHVLNNHTSRVNKKQPNSS